MSYSKHSSLSINSVLNLKILSVMIAKQTQLSQSAVLFGRIAEFHLVLYLNNHVAINITTYTSDAANIKLNVTHQNRTKYIIWPDLHAFKMKRFPIFYGNQGWRNELSISCFQAEFSQTEHIFHY